MRVGRRARFSGFDFGFWVRVRVSVRIRVVFTYSFEVSAEWVRSITGTIRKCMLLLCKKKHHKILTKSKFVKCHEHHW